MGALCSGGSGGGAGTEDKMNREITRRNRKDAETDQRRIKLLLLGAGESGKSTIFKQMRLLYGKEKNFTENELKKAALTIYTNIITDVQTVIQKSYEIAPFSPKLKEAAEGVLRQPYEAPTALVDDAVGKMIKALWADKGIQATWAARSQYQVQDALSHYCDSIDRISSPGYVPTIKDILLTRVRTSGIVEEHYTIEGVDFVMFDVGGQRNERRKWIHCFDNVTAVIFVAAMNEYDQALYEDNKVNRMDEAVILFEEICNSKWFVKTSMILFLNKKDLFREKLLTAPFRSDAPGDERFTDFAGPHVVPGTPSAQYESPEYEQCYEAAADYLLQLFLSRKKASSAKKIYSHITCATDTSNVSTVFDSCRDIILKENLVTGGFFNPAEAGP
jgi:guanine nucleotide-binding protein G(i) subunit alpha